MSKLFKRVSGITLGLALCFGFSFSCSNKQSSSQMARAEAAVYAEAIFNATNNEKGVGSYTTTFTNTTNGFVWDVENFNNNNNGWDYIKCGSKNSASVGVIKTHEAVSDPITKVTITIDALTASSVNSITLYGGSDGTASLGTFSKAKGTQTVEIDSADQGADQIYKIAFDCKKGSSNGLVTVSSVKLFYEAGTLATSVSISSEYYVPVEKVITMEKGDGGGSNSDELTAIVLPENADDRSVTWSSNNESVAVVDNSGYVIVDTSAVGQATITATANGGTNVSDYVIYSIVNTAGVDYDISTSVTNGSYSGPTTIKEESSATITIEANDGYALPDEITVTGATLTSYNPSTGEVVISNPTGNVTITAVCALYTNSTSLVEGSYYITYTYEDTKYYVRDIASTGKTTDKRTEAAAFNFALVGNDAWAISKDGFYINIGCTSTSITLGSLEPLTISWLDEENGIRKIGNANREFAWYAANHEFRSYTHSDESTHGVILEPAKEVAGFSVNDDNANKNVLKGSNFDSAAAAAAGFEARLDYTDGTYSVVTSDATWTLNTDSVGTETLTVTYLDYDAVIFYDINIYVVTITRLEVDASSAKTSYIEGDALILENLIITGYDSSNKAYPLQEADCTFSPSYGYSVALGDTSVEVTYENEDSSTASTSYSISVAPFVGFVKVTSVDDITVGDSYVLGVYNVNKENDLMGAADHNNNAAWRKSVNCEAAVSGNKDKVTNANIPEGVTFITLLSDGNGKYAMYDMNNKKYISGDASANSLHDNDTLAEAGNSAWWTISFENDFMSMTLNGSSKVLAYNLSANRFASYASYASNSYNVTSGQVHPSLFKMVGSDVKDDVDSFASSSLKMGNADYEGDIVTENCSENYQGMKTAYAGLSDAEKNVFQYSDDFADARARLNAWATANGEVFTYGNETPFESLRRIGANGDILSGQDDNTLIVLLGVFSLGVSALSAFYLVKKRKRAQ